MLASLNPRWVFAHGRPGERIALAFDCPGACCSRKPLSEVDTGDKPTEHTRERLFVPFANPLDGAAPIGGHGCLWQRTGEAFETLSLMPSVDASAWGHWHGFVTDGECK